MYGFLMANNGPITPEAITQWVTQHHQRTLYMFQVHPGCFDKLDYINSRG